MFSTFGQVKGNARCGRSRTPGMNVGFAHTKRSLAAKELLMLVVTGQSLLRTIHTALQGIPDWLRNLATMTVRKVSLMLKHLRHFAPALIVVSVCGRTFFFLKKKIFHMFLRGSSCHTWR